MARPYGFRIYVVRAFHNVKRGRDPVGVYVGSPAQLRILEILDELASGGTHFMPPRVSNPDEPPRPTASITVGPVSAVRPDLYHLSVASGEQGSHKAATREGDPPLDLNDWSPEAAHYVTLLFPEVEGDRFVMVVESIRRRDPLVRLISRMTEKDLEAKKVSQMAEETARQAARDAGEAVPVRQRHTRLLFDAHQASDSKYIDQILAGAKSASAVFTQSVPSDRGGLAAHVQRRLSINLLDEKGKDVARTTGQYWFGRLREGQTTSKAAGVSELGDLLEEENLLDEGEAGVYDSASITVKSESSESTTIAVDTMRDVFTYPVSDGAPTVQFYYDKISPRVAIVAAEEAIEVLSIDAAKVVQCLEGSTRFP